MCELHDRNHISHPESVLPSEGYIYVNFPTRPPKRCSRKLCSTGLICVPEAESYNCISCEEAKAEQVLNFPRKSTEDHAILDEPFTSSLSAFTLSLWVQVGDTSTEHSMVSFASASPLHDNAINVYIRTTDVVIDINNNQKINSGISLIDNKWHHISFAWENTNGNAKLYIDGVLRSSWITQQGKVISKGVFVLGQEQDGYRSSFDSSQAMKGNITSVNLWSRDFTSGEVSALTTTCPTIEGDIVQWSTLRKMATGLVKLVCSSFCM
ncbi:neuronal pentraxin-1-like [Exaiptasia diaphana]|uniref:Pentraxin (PTX) domain-containing protein n=1 Tax=Exaiptasia diaphana TaxID=2652724 RepID=A0A913YX38_EXADI|nr:neuronal pentraxin-1-like [Exaiptasia diaphana]